MRREIKLILQVIIIGSSLILSSNFDLLGQKKGGNKIKFSIREDKYSRILLKIENLRLDSVVISTKWYIGDRYRQNYIIEYTKSILSNNWVCIDPNSYLSYYSFNEGKVILPPKSYIIVPLGANSLKNVYIKYKIKTFYLSLSEQKFFSNEFETNTIYISEKKVEE